MSQELPLMPRSLMCAEDVLEMRESWHEALTRLDLGHETLETLSSGPIYSESAILKTSLCSEFLTSGHVYG